jgi:hypothetical protein
MTWESEPTAHLPAREPEQIRPISEYYGRTNHGNALTSYRLANALLQAIRVDRGVVVQE